MGMGVLPHSEPGPEDLWFLPLGGCGEVGMNLNLFGHNGQWIMVDCGVHFTRPQDFNAQPIIEMPDTSFVDHLKGRLIALLVTHAHEDHIGAIATLWHRWDCPLVATPFAAEIIRRRARGRRSPVPEPIIETHPGNEKHFGCFKVRWVAMNHSTPETCGLEIETAAGRIFHSADWKIDTAPLLGKGFTKKPYEALGLRGVDAMTSDSTNAFVEGSSASESEVRSNLIELIQQLDGRVVVTCFSSNIVRLQTILEAASKSGRYVCLLGRSVSMMVDCAKSLQLLNDDFSWVEQRHVGYLPPEEVLFIATGSQGEVDSGLSRLSKRSHRHVDLEKGDTVIFSSRTIPGNEKAVQSLCKRFRDAGVNVLHADESSLVLHASGHPCQEELETMYRLINPRVVIPVHGDTKHLGKNAQIAENVGVPEIIKGLNGDLFMISPKPSVIKNFCKVGRVLESPA